MAAQLKDYGYARPPVARTTADGMLKLIAIGKASGQPTQALKDFLRKNGN